MPLFDLLMRGPRALDALLLDERELPRTTQRLLLLSLLGLLVHGLVLGATAHMLPPQFAGPFSSRGNPALWMPLAFAGSFLGALAICLPSFWFYTQLSGLDASFRLVTAQALRTQATTSVLLLGILPFYAAYALACAVHLLDGACVMAVGYALPFAMGLFGVHALYQAFAELAQRLPRTHARRGNFLLRMVLAWAAVYSVVAPVMLWKLGQALGSLG
jgi:hypothetical protein